MNQIIENYMKKHTLLGVGAMSSCCVKATIEVVEKYECPIIFVCSRNQIESHKFGGGYVNGWDSKDISKYVRKAAEERKVSNLIYIGRDHGGPWQNDSEYNQNFDEEKAFSNCLLSYYEDLEAGFEFIHIDTSKDPNYRQVPMDIAIERAVLILKKLEEYRISKNIKEVSYEISLDETRISEQTLQEYQRFCEQIVARIKSEMLPKPVFVVGNTGTYTKMDMNLGEVDSEIVKNLYEISESQGVYLKEHNADYLDTDTLERHFELGIRMINVAPEFAKVETSILLKLESLWNIYVDCVSLDSKNKTNIKNILIDNIITSEKWKKWIDYDDNIENLRKDGQILDRIVNVNGHYFYNNELVIKEREKLLANLERFHLLHDPERYIINEIRSSIEHYIKSFNKETKYEEQI